MKAAIYARVSSEDQRESGTIATQVEYARRYCELNSIDVAGWYLDDGISGTIPMHQRPQGRRLLADAAAKTFEVVLVYRVDRFARRLKVLLDSYEALEASGIGLRSMTEPIDSTSPMGRFVFQLLGSIAELERETIIERTKAGRRRAAKEGRFVSGRTPFGYVRVAQRLEVDNAVIAGVGISAAEVVALCFRQVAHERWSAQQVADHVNALRVPLWHHRNGANVASYDRWSDRRINKLLHLSTYYGESVHGESTLTVPAIVDRALWQCVQEQLVANRIVHGGVNTTYPYLLRGLLRCGVCGSRYVGDCKTENGVRTPRYRCQGHQRYVGKLLGPCPSAIVRAQVLEDTVWCAVCRVIADPGDLLTRAYQETQHQHDRMTLNRECRAIEAALVAKTREKEIVARLARSERITIEDAEAQLDEVSVETRKLLAQRETLFARLSEAVDSEKTYLDTIALLDRLRVNIATNDQSVKRATLEALIKEIEVHTEWGGHNGQRRTGAKVRLVLHPVLVVGTIELSGAVGR